MLYSCTHEQATGWLFACPKCAATQGACLQDWVDHEQVMLQRNLGPGCLHLPYIVLPGPVGMYKTAMTHVSFSQCGLQTSINEFT